jgi:hypothetical protein
MLQTPQVKHTTRVRSKQVFWRSTRAGVASAVAARAAVRVRRRIFVMFDLEVKVFGGCWGVWTRR